ncbi:hypothetical protein An04g05350 [Aspergillus niger]|uniref:Uncharacterized protein n=2 Tax=Aspergillus niger TaxID=5061 RepID=A2QJ03_ASPNC|nr:hypothetical protein An04g05350 [Aspergillus niger]CAK38797.1 hypothetical protein An04g05350 [Aspergillus niger]
MTVTGVAVADRIRQPKPMQLVNKLPAMEGKRTKIRKRPGSGRDGGSSSGGSKRGYDETRKGEDGWRIYAGGKPDRWMNGEIQMLYDVDIGGAKSKEWAEVCKGGRTVWVTSGQDPAGGLFFPLSVSASLIWVYSSAAMSIGIYGQERVSQAKSLGRLVSLHELGPDHPWPAARIHGPKQLADDPLLSELTKRRH